MSLFSGFVDAVAEKVIGSQTKALVNGWVQAGYLEPAKAAECEAGIMDLVEVAFGMVAKGQNAPAPKP